jgi:hypothetical protein
VILTRFSDPHSFIEWNRKTPSFSTQHTVAHDWALLNDLTPINPTVREWLTNANAIGSTAGVGGADGHIGHIGHQVRTWLISPFECLLVGSFLDTDTEWP